MTLRFPLSYGQSGVIGEDLSSIIVHISALCKMIFLYAPVSGIIRAN